MITVSSCGVKLLSGLERQAKTMGIHALLWLFQHYYTIYFFFPLGVEQLNYSTLFLHYCNKLVLVVPKMWVKPEDSDLCQQMLFLVRG